MLSACLLVDPALQFRIVDEAVGLSKLGAGGLVQVRGATTGRNVGLLATEPAGEAPSLLSLLLLCGAFFLKGVVSVCPL